MSGIIGRKISMTRVFDEHGKSVPVTVIDAGPCFVTQIKTSETDGYNALQLAFEDKKEKNTTKSQLKHFAKAGVTPKRVVKEFRSMDKADKYSPGDTIKVDLFKEGEKVTVSGWSKGKGFQGVVKRYGFAGGPKSHGQSDRLRAPGSIGQSASPSRVFKGVKMGGRMGNQKVTLKNRRVVKIFEEKNMIMIEGAVPGARNGLVIITR